MQVNQQDAELFLALSHLRYLSTDQIARGWYGGRPVDSVGRRLRKLREAMLVENVVVSADGEFGWRLTAAGIQRLRSLRGGDFFLYREVTALFLRHLLDTNEVFIALANGEWVWERLPFTWIGSNRAMVTFDGYRGGQRQLCILRPDALVTPAAASGPRVFIELDRSTECIREREGRRSIRGKLRAYRALTHLPAVREREPAYDLQFPDRRPPRLVFVLSKDPHGQRRSAIMESAAELTPELQVRCVSLADPAALRHECGLAPGAPAPTRAASLSRVSATGIRKLTTFYREAVGALRESGLSPEQRKAIGPVVREARAVLERLAETSGAE